MHNPHPKFDVEIMEDPGPMKKPNTQFLSDGGTAACWGEYAETWTNAICEEDAA